ncbi:MAG: hypothetical protein QNJ14_06930 [Woeseiaceae bacterium]|nr:hypothetical protein [Woeseiaceae bacterium]
MSEYKKYDDLPDWLKTELRAFPDEGRYSVQVPIPVLGYRSIVETMNMPDGPLRMRDYFNTLRSR